MAITFFCECGTKLRAAEDHANKRCKCSGCGRILRIPAVNLLQSPASTAIPSVEKTKRPMRPASLPPDGPQAGWTKPVATTPNQSAEIDEKSLSNYDSAEPVPANRLSRRQMLTMISVPSLLVIGTILAVLFRGREEKPQPTALTQQKGELASRDRKMAEEAKSAVAAPDPPRRASTQPPRHETGTAAPTEIAVVAPKPQVERKSKPKPQAERKPKSNPQLVALFHNLAYRLSFSFYWNEKIEVAVDGRSLSPKLMGLPEPSSQSLFIPHLDGYLRGYTTEGYIRTINSELTYLNTMLKVDDQNLRKATEELRRIFLFRVYLNFLIERYGLTLSSSIAMMRAAVWGTALRNLGQRDDEKEFKNAEAAAKDISDELGSAQQFNAVVRYADMDAVDRAAQLWQQTLLPWAKKTAGPAVARKLISLQPKWVRKTLVIQRFVSTVGFQALHHVSITNVSGKKLTHVIVELQMSNEWKDKVANYYYIPELGAGSTCHLLPHPRWVSRRSYSRDMTLNYSVWAVENSNVNCTMIIKNPEPAPNAEEYRKNVLSWDHGPLGKMSSKLALSYFISVPRR